MTETHLLRLEHVAVGYDRHVVLSDIHLTLARRRFTGLLGANGTGKSTLIKTILGIIPPLSGRMEFEPVDGRPHVLGYVPQRETLDPIFLLSSFEVVLMGTSVRVQPGLRPSQDERAWASECLKQTGADHLSKKLFSQLSGGQKQRVLIARALATRPDFLLLDEPTSGIDAAARQAVMEVLRRIHQEQGLTILMASHDLPVVKAFVQEVMWLHEGKVLQGPVAEMLSPQKIEEILDLEMN